MTSERQLIQMVANGYSMRKIADGTGLSAANVSNILMKIRIKYKARNSPHLVSIAYQSGILQAPEFDEQIENSLRVG